MFNTLLPAVVCVVIMMVNGNVGIGVAVAGDFKLDSGENIFFDDYKLSGNQRRRTLYNKR